jgi:hypothetical protein
MGLQELVDRGELANKLIRLSEMASRQTNELEAAILRDIPEVLNAGELSKTWGVSSDDPAVVQAVAISESLHGSLKALQAIRDKIVNDLK